MQTVAVAEVLAAEGLGPPALNVLVPNEQNYRVSLMQPQGDIEISGAGVRNRDQASAAAQFGAFLRDARETDADLVVTPEYSMPWSTLTAALQAAIIPSQGKLWAIGCESIRYNELQQLKQDFAPVATVIFETLPVQQDRFLDPLAYIFLAPPTDGNGAARLVMLVQFKTFPMADNNHFETNGMQRGTRIYRFGVAGQSISLVALICSDALDFYDADAAAIYDRALIVHIQMNPSPRHDRFRQYRDKLLGLQGDTTEILCLNWAKGVRVLLNGQTQQWQDISGSAWYLKPQAFDDRDQTLVANHRRGLYYTWFDPLYSHALFFNFEPATFLLTVSKVAHINVLGVVSRRRGPQLTRICGWDAATTLWAERMTAEDGFAAIAGEGGNASNQIRAISERNPFEAERILALCSGKIDHVEAWHGVRKLDSCSISKTEIIRRLTFCQDTHQEAADFRLERLRRCGDLWDILTTEANLPPSLGDFPQGFTLGWTDQFPHQNATSSAGRRATVIYMGEGHNLERVRQIKKRAAIFLQRSVNDPDDSIAARQRLAVWFRDGGVLKLCDPHEYVQIDRTGAASEFDISRDQ
jgi:hypothetical protein